MHHVVQLPERFHPGIAGSDEDEAELGGIFRVDHRPLELDEDAVAKGDRVREVLEARAVLGEPGDGQDASSRAERDDEARVLDLDGPGESLHADAPVLAVVRRHVPEEQLRVRAHLPERHDHVPGFERAGRGLGQERRVQHEVLERDDGRASTLQETCDVATREPASEDERPAACRASLHGSCLPRRWRTRSR